MQYEPDNIYFQKLGIAAISDYFFDGDEIGANQQPLKKGLLNILSKLIESIDTLTNVKKRKGFTFFKKKSDEQEYKKKK